MGAWDVRCAVPSGTTPGGKEDGRVLGRDERMTTLLGSSEFAFEETG